MKITVDIEFTKPENIDLRIYNLENDADHFRPSPDVIKRTGRKITEELTRILETR